jgi:hypothetical protein
MLTYQNVIAFLYVGGNAAESISEWLKLDLTDVQSVIATLREGDIPKISQESLKMSIVKDREHERKQMLARVIEALGGTDRKAIAAAVEHIEGAVLFVKSLPSVIDEQ